MEFKQFDPDPIPKVMRLLASTLLLFLLSACSEQVDTGPGEVRWDREICVRCAMAVSDHNYAAQVRRVIPGQHSKLYKFDDIGCAVIWLDEQSWKDDPLVEIWVTDYRTGEWIDARKSNYVGGKITPMDYGLGATSEAPGGQQLLNYAEARAHIHKIEEKYQMHATPDKRHPNAAPE